MDRQALAEAVYAGRVALGLGKEEAARRAGISSITWKRIEDALPIRDEKYADVERALGWPAGSCLSLLAGRRVLPDTHEEIIDAIRRKYGNAQAEAHAAMIRAFNERHPPPASPPSSQDTDVG